MFDTYKFELLHGLTFGSCDWAGISTAAYHLKRVSKCVILLFGRTDPLK